ncbi:S-layer homology domain-containing protein [Brevibacillus dissolubilis]|uniref:S-layer homology domain-containing protein n=1 Tax=Brevibacillus dissolubilis TaxID=1844116 RepID=UPI00159B8505|nr:S-layer homology domain-containing protein [Brevibacillus dissolubilis]
MKKLTHIMLTAILTTGSFHSTSSIVQPVSASQGVANDYNAHIASQDISYVLKHHLMWVYPDGSFKPDEPITQAQLVSSLVVVSGAKGQASVPELPAKHWAKATYEKAKQAGFLFDVKIEPDKKLNREEAARLTINAWEKHRRYRTQKNEGLSKSWSDVQFLVATGIMKPKAGAFPNGVSTSKFDSLAQITRAEVASMIRLLHTDLVEMQEGEKIAQEVHKNLTVENGKVVGRIPKNRFNWRVSVGFYFKDGRYENYFAGQYFAVPIASIKLMNVSVLNSQSTILADYDYKELPSLTRTKDM